MEVKLETKCPKCEHVFLTSYEEKESKLSEAELAEAVKLHEEHAKLGEEVASLKEEVARLSSDEYALASLRDWVRKLPRDDFYKLGVELGYLEGPEATAEEVAKVEEEKQGETVTLASLIIQSIAKKIPA